MGGRNVSCLLIPYLFYFICLTWPIILYGISVHNLKVLAKFQRSRYVEGQVKPTSIYSLTSVPKT